MDAGSPVEVFTSLRMRPELNDAACIGRPALFDDVIDGESRHARRTRHQKAAVICRKCPVLAACGRLAHTMTAGGGPGGGVWAGHLHT